MAPPVRQTVLRLSDPFHPRRPPVIGFLAILVDRFISAGSPSGNGIGHVPIRADTWIKAEKGTRPFSISKAAR